MGMLLSLLAACVHVIDFIEGMWECHFYNFWHVGMSMSLLAACGHVIPNERCMKGAVLAISGNRS